MEVEFRRPILLPATVTFEGDPGRFSVRDTEKGTPHLEGTAS